MIDQSTLVLLSQISFYLIFVIPIAIIAFLVAGKVASFYRNEPATETETEEEKPKKGRFSLFRRKQKSQEEVFKKMFEENLISKQTENKVNLKPSVVQEARENSFFEEKSFRQKFLPDRLNPGFKSDSENGETEAEKPKIEENKFDNVIGRAIEKAIMTGKVDLDIKIVLGKTEDGAEKIKIFERDGGITGQIKIVSKEEDSKEEEHKSEDKVFEREEKEEKERRSVTEAKSTETRKVSALEMLKQRRKLVDEEEEKENIG